MSYTIWGVKINIRNIRKQLKMTQKDFSKKIDISLRYLQNIEKGDNKPSLDLLESISKKLKISIHDLIDD